MSRNIQNEQKIMKLLVNELNVKFPIRTWHPEHNNFYIDLYVRKLEWVLYCSDYYLMISPLVKCYLSIAKRKFKKIGFKFCLLHPISIDILEQRNSKYFV